LLSIIGTAEATNIEWSIMENIRQKKTDTPKAEIKKIKCPYCKAIEDWCGGSKCPSCGKYALKPGFFVRKDFIRHERKPRTVIMPWLLSGTMWNYAAFMGKMPRWVIYLGGFCIVGAFLLAPHLSSESPEALAAAKYNLNVLGIALDLFKKDCGRYPTTAEGLSALVKDPQIKGWKGPYIEKLKNDPWKHQFMYSLVGENVFLYSTGLDGIDGSKDDVFNTSVSPASANPLNEDDEAVVTVTVGK